MRRVRLFVSWGVGETFKLDKPRKGELVIDKVLKSATLYFVSPLTLQSTVFFRTL
jgi:hypothetical protein